MSASRKASKSFWLIPGLACLLLMLAGLAARQDTRVEAGVRRSAPKEHFQSGAQRSESLLAEILTIDQEKDATSTTVLDQPVDRSDSE